MTNRFYKIWRVLLVWLLLIVASNLHLFGFYHLNPDITFFILSHLCLLAIYLTFRKTSKPSNDTKNNKITEGFNPLLSKTNPLLILILYLIFSICFWLHLNIIADFLIVRFPDVFERFYNFAFQYSSQLKSTFLMLAANLSMWAVLILSTWNGISNVIQTNDDKPSSEIKPANLIWVSTLVFLGLIFFALLRHNTFHSKAWDLAIFAQLIDNFRHGVFFEANVRGVSNIFSDHFTPIIYIFSPLLYLWNDPSRLLLVMQAAFITLGAIPTFLIARKRTNSPTVGFCMGVVYLLLPTLQYMNVFDFHPVVLSIPLMLFAWYFWESRRFSLMYLFLFLTMLCHEQMWIVVGALGLYLALFERERIRGISLAVIGWGGFLCLVLWFFPMFRGGEEYFYIHRYAYLGDSMGEIVKSILTKPQLWLPRLVSPQSLMFIILMLLPVAFLPLWRPKYLLIILPTYFYSALSIESLQTSIFAQYAAPYVPFVIIASIYGLERISKKTFDKATTLVVFKCVGFIAVCAALIANVYFSPYIHGRAYQREVFKRSSNYMPIHDYKSHYHIINEYPARVSVSAFSNLAPHIIRQNMYLFPDCENADYIIFDLSDMKNPAIADEIEILLGQTGFSDFGSYRSLVCLRRDPRVEITVSEMLKQQEECSPNKDWSDVVKDYYWINTQHKESDNPKFNGPIHLESGMYTTSVDSIKLARGEFRKAKETKKHYFGVVLYPQKLSNIYFYGEKPIFYIHQFFHEYKSIDGWQVGESEEYYLQYPHKTSEYLWKNKKLPLFLLFELPQDYPNTLEEYITEMSIQERWLGRIFHDTTIPKDGFRDEFEFVE